VRRGERERGKDEGREEEREGKRGLVRRRRERENTLITTMFSHYDISGY
jgi:hypothetical protein